MENNPGGDRNIRGMGMFGHAVLPDLAIPMIATRRYRSGMRRRGLLKLDFSGKQTRELLGERDINDE